MNIVKSFLEVSVVDSKRCLELLALLNDVSEGGDLLSITSVTLETKGSNQLPPSTG